MLILFILLFLFLTIVVGFSYIDEFVFIPAILCCIAVLFLFINICTLVNGRHIDEKIEMYTEENQNIENQINITVAKYMEFESDTYEALKGDSGITLVSLYPELKSDELIKMQIETYTANNEKIKELKEDKININAAKWWVYFGGGN